MERAYSEMKCALKSSHHFATLHGTKSLSFRGSSHDDGVDVVRSLVFNVLKPKELMLSYISVESFYKQKIN